LRGRLRALVAVGVAVSLPAHAIVDGIGLRQLTSSYTPTVDVGQAAVVSLVDLLVVGPLVTAACIRVVVREPARERPGLAAALAFAFELFPRAVLVLTLATVGIFCGLLLFVVPGLYLAVRWALVLPVLALEDVNPLAALRRSGQLVRGAFWRCAFVVAAGSLFASVAAFAIGSPFAAVARSTDAAAWLVVGQGLSSAVALPTVAVFATVLYFDRRSGGQPLAAVDRGSGARDD